ncbi:MULTISPECIES: hypothetical protein [Streptomyces]|uniref:hypothetical protein n=1 Tax=Streptomyces TaxID=1883 RepID=UPI001E47F655|nr:MULTISPECIES: hypothetical protein [Streptomyces]UFQ14644.1 hypothetical protein J2N69_06235 [Streptomyces huasconensis]WCL84246.1 hypothetical protein PPN52_06240 [Streptomyces sp. JCM 35825]
MFAVRFALRPPARTCTLVRAFCRAYVVHRRPAYERTVEIHHRVTLGAECPRWAIAAALSYRMAYHHLVAADLPEPWLPVLLVIGRRHRTAIGKPTVTRPQGAGVHRVACRSKVSLHVFE